ncbi:MAG: TetR/AcrR family transcriptional regulator [Arthrobacter sp.]
MAEEHRGRRRRNRQGELSRRKVLEATALLASREGHRAASIARITRLTGVPASSIYWHFGDKQTLLAAAMQHSYRESRPEAPRWQPSNGAENRIARLLANVTYGRTSHLRAGYWQLGLTIAIEGNPQDAPLQALFEEIRAERREQILDWWQAEVGPTHSELMADMTLALLDGRYIRNALGPPLHDDVSILACHGLLHLAEHPAVPVSVPVPIRIPADSSTCSATSRTTLLRAATVVLSEQGFHGATITKICEEANLPSSSLYWSFRNKGDLLAAVVREGRTAPASSLDRCLPHIPVAWEPDMASALRVHLAWTEEEPEIPRVSHLLSLQRQEGADSGRQTLAALRADSRSGVDSWLQRALGPFAGANDSAHLAEVPELLADGLFVNRQLGGLKDPLPDHAGVIIRVMQGAVRALGEERPPVVGSR